MNKQESSNYFAHINYEEERFQSLCAHLEEVAQQAADFAAEFNSRDWGYIAALWHDLGKYDQNWQAYLKNKTGYDTSHKGTTQPSRSARLC